MEKLNAIVWIGLIVLFIINYYMFKKENKTNRNSNIELLRIFSMVSIVAHHFAYHGYGITGLAMTKNKLLLDFLVPSGKIGVNIFVIISAYYLIEKKYSWKGVLKLIISIKIYALLFLLFAIIGKEQISLFSMIKSLFPIIYGLYWFISCYVLLYMIAPFLNIFLNNISKFQLKQFILLCSVIYIFINVFMGANLFFSRIIWFIILYIITYYFKIYVDIENIKTNKLLISSILCYILLYMSVVGFDILGIKHIIFRTHMLHFIAENSIFSVIISFCLWLNYLKKDPKYSKIINYISSGTLSVYIIHENVFVRPILYNKILKTGTFITFDFIQFMVYSICSVAGTFIICLMIGKITEYILQVTVFKVICLTKLEENLKKYMNKLLNSFNNYEKIK